MKISTLFPDFHKQPTNNNRRAYVKAMLEEMAQAGTLFLSDCLGEDEPLCTLVGDAILGYDLDDDGNFTKGNYIPEALRAFRVKVRSIQHTVQHDDYDSPLRPGPDSPHVTYKREKTPITYDIESRKVDESHLPNAVQTKATGGVFAATTRWEKHTIATGEMEAELSTEHAVWCLRAQGKNVKRAPTRRRQGVYWKVEEVRPGSEEPKAKRKPGRPPKDAQQAEVASE